MKRIISAILCLLMVVSLCACGGDSDSSTKTYTHKNVTMSVPGDFEDMTEEAGVDVYEFVVGTQLNLVLGGKIENCDVDDYMDAIGSSLNISKSATDKGSYTYFQYKNTAMNYDYIYDVALVEDGNDLWVIQVSSLESEYSKNKSMMMDILDSIVVK